MADPKGSTPSEDLLDEPQDPDEVEASPEPDPPPRRRLVAELLEGQEHIVESTKAGLQLVAPPLHIEPVDTGQPVYQLDLSSDEPTAMLVEPEPVPRTEPAAAPAHAPAQEAPRPARTKIPTDSVHAALRHMVSQRDRRVMAAERDGIDAYELAAGIDDFVATILEVVHSFES
jgi:hypothetical protein